MYLAIISNAQYPMYNIQFSMNEHPLSRTAFAEHLELKIDY